MINLNVLYAKLLLSILYVKKEKNIIHANKLKNKIEIVSNNAFVILVIFKNNVVSI